MTTASNTTATDENSFSTDQGTVYLTASEIAQIEADPFLEIEDIVQYRAGGDGE